MAALPSLIYVPCPICSQALLIDVVEIGMPRLDGQGSLQINVDMRMRQESVEHLHADVARRRAAALN